MTDIPTGPFTIKQLTVRGFLGVTAVDITPDPDGNLVVISGANGQGKTSTIDAIWHAIDYRNASKTVDEPIHEGDDVADVIVDLGDIVVHRTWKRSRKGATTSELRVSAKDGSRFNSQQALLDSFFSKVTLSPMGFLGLGKTEQIKELVNILAMDIDPFALADQRKAVAAQRLDAGRTLKTAQGALDSMPADPDAPTVELSAQSVLAEQSEAAQEHARQRSLRADLDRAEERVTAADDLVVRLRDQLNEAETAATAAYGYLDTVKDQVNRLPELPYMDDFPARLEEVEEQNRRYRAAVERRKAAAVVDEARAEHDALEAQIDALDEKRRNALADVEWPMDGLGFDEEVGVLFNGRPLTQASEAEQAMVALHIAMAAQPELRVMRLEGSRLDTASLRRLEDVAAEHGMQVWVEVVDDTPGAIGFVIEDGRVKP